MSLLTACESIEACARAETRAVESLEARIKKAIDERNYHEIPRLVEEHNYETRLTRVARMRAERLAFK